MNDFLRESLVPDEHTHGKICLAVVLLKANSTTASQSSSSELTFRDRLTWSMSSFCKVAWIKAPWRAFKGSFGRRQFKGANKIRLIL